MTLPPECTLPLIADLRDRLVEALAATRHLEIDAGRMRIADLSFVQLMVSASSSAAAAGKTLSLHGLSEAGRSIFLRAGLDVDPSGAVVNA